MNTKDVSIGQYSVVKRTKMKWIVVEERRVWTSSCGGYRINRYAKDDFYVEVARDLCVQEGYHQPSYLSKRFANYPSKGAAVHYLEHVASSNDRQLVARSFMAPVGINWKKLERGIYSGCPTLVNQTNYHYDAVTIEQTPDGWELSFNLHNQWWRYIGECYGDVPEQINWAVKGETFTFSTKKEAGEAAEYGVRDILGLWSHKFNWENMDDQVRGWFGMEDKCRSELKALIVEAETLGMCEDMFLAHVFAHAARGGSPTVVECLDSAKALMAIWREYGQ